MNDLQYGDNAHLFFQTRPGLFGSIFLRLLQNLCVEDREGHRHYFHSDESSIILHRQSQCYNHLTDRETDKS